MQYTTRFCILLLFVLILLFVAIQDYSWSTGNRQRKLTESIATINHKESLKDKTTEFGDFQPFSYAIEPEFCLNKLSNAKIALYITTGPTQNNIESRNIVRTSWAANASEHGVQVFFFLGVPKTKVRTSLNNYSTFEENSQYGDILQGNFDDNSSPLIYKFWSAIHYHGSHCTHIPFLAWMDMDVVVFPENLSKLLIESGEKYINAIGCTTVHGQPTDSFLKSRHPEIWQQRYLPPYCSSPFILMETQVAQKLSTAVPQLGTDFILSSNIFDVATGLIASKAGIQIIPLKGVFSHLPVSDICASTTFALRGLKPPQIIPQFLEYREDCCAQQDGECFFDGILQT